MNLNHLFIGDPAAKKIIIFLHEGLGSIAQWKQFPELICEASNSYGLIYDRSGYGKSPGSLLNRSINYLEESALELENLIHSTELSRYKLFLYGHSDGGSIALIYASKHPERLSGIITEAAHVFVEEITVEGVRKALPVFTEGKFDGLKKYHGERFKEVFLAWNNIWLDPAFMTWNISGILHKISCPVLIIQGKNDQYGTLKQVETIAKLISGDATVYTPENCNHAPHKEAQKEVIKIVQQFIVNLKVHDES